MCDVTVQGELTQRLHGGDVGWISSRWSKRIRDALADKLIANPDDSGIIMNTGQMYLVDGIYLEIVGKIHASNPTELLCLEWHEDRSNKQCLWRKGNTLAAQCIRLAMEFTGVRRILVRVMNKDEDGGRLRARIISCSECSDPCSGIPIQNNVIEEINEFAYAIAEAMTATGHNYLLYTDGSHNINPMQKEAVLRSNRENQRDGRISAAIVAIACHDSWRQSAIYVLYLSSSDKLGGVQAYTAELIALVVAVRVSRIAMGVRIRSDCKAAIETVKKVHSTSAKKNQFCDIRPILGTLEQVQDLPDIEWVPSHPERRIADSLLWQVDDWGSYMADLAAKGQLRLLTGQFRVAESNIKSVSIDVAMMNLIVPGVWYWKRMDSEVPVLNSIIQFHSERRTNMYFKSRDEYRIKRGEEGRWVGSSLALAAKCWKQVASGVLGSNIALKNCLDKYFHGRNRAKGLMGAEAEMMLACHVCGKPDSQKHIILECQHAELQNIRKVAKGKVKDEARAEKRKHGHECKYIARILDFILANGFNAQYNHYDRIWTGLWNETVLNDALSFGARDGEWYPEAISYQGICMIEDSICRVTMHLAEALNELMRIHRVADGLAMDGPTIELDKFKDRIGVRKGENLEEARNKNNELILGDNKQPNINEKRRKRKLYGGKCSRQWRKRQLRGKNKKEKEDEERLNVELSECCIIGINNYLRMEGSIIENTSHPTGATCFRDHDHD